MIRAAAALLVLGTVSACGLQPMYAGGASSPVVQGLAAVEIPPISGRDGWLVHNALTERFGIAGAGADGIGTSPQYRLDVRLDDSLQSLGVLNDDTISRERRILRTRFQLVDIATGEILMDATAGSDAGIDVVSSEYATIAAEQTALENLARDVASRMTRRVALTLRERERAGEP